MLTIVALSFERFLVIRYPVLSRRIRKHHIILTIVLIWLVSLVLMLPMVIVRGITLHPMSLDPKHPLNICHEKWSSMERRQTMDLLLFVLIYVIPGVLVVVLHSTSGCHLIMGSEELHRQGSVVSHSQKVLQGRRRVARMLVLLAVLFAVSWMPYHIVTLCTDFRPYSMDSYGALMSFSLLLGHSNSAQNPVIYCLMNKYFRKGIKQLFSCGKRQVRVSQQKSIHASPAQSTFV